MATIGKGEDVFIYRDGRVICNNCANSLLPQKPHDTWETRPVQRYAIENLTCSICGTSEERKTFPISIF